MPDFTPFWISLKVAVISTIIVMILSIIIARLLYRGTGHFTKLLESLILLPIVLPPTVMGFILLIIFHRVVLWGNFSKCLTSSSGIYNDRCSICHC